MSFEQERIADERAQVFHDRVSEILASIDKPTTDQIARAIGQAQQELDPNHGELIYVPAEETA